jgi:hypothetical protein
MALSVTVHGIPVKAGTQNPGRLATADIQTQDGSDVVLYTVPTVTDVEWDYLIFSVSVCNRSSVSANNISIAVADANTPVNSEFVEWNTSLVPRGVLERTQLIANPGQRIIVRWENETAGIKLDGSSDGNTVGNELAENETAQFILTLVNETVADIGSYIAPDIYWEIPTATTAEFTAVSGTISGGTGTTAYNAATTTAKTTYPIDITASSPMGTKGSYLVNFYKTDASGRLLTASTLQLGAPPTILPITRFYYQSNDMMRVDIGTQANYDALGGVIPAGTITMVADGTTYIYDNTSGELTLSQGSGPFTSGYEAWFSNASDSNWDTVPPALTILTVTSFVIN